MLYSQLCRMKQGFNLAILALVCSQVASQNNGDIRLLDYTVDHHSGRLEIYIGDGGNGEWSTVCYNKISPGAAQAACRQLGYSDYVKVDTVANMGIKHGSGVILFSDVYCPYNSGDQHILRCSFRQSRDPCPHSQDMAIICSTSSITPYDTAVRLVDGGTGYTSSGTVEVYLNKQWGTMCAYTIGPREAVTICQQLGYTTTSGYSSTKSSISTRVWLDKVHCANSTESCLNLCFTYPDSTSPQPACSNVATVNCSFNIIEKNSTTSGSESLCTNNLAIEKHLIAIIVGALVAFLFVCLFFILIPIICCCCCIPGCILHSCQERRGAYKVIQ